jgi:hypothetical protein
MFHLPSALRRRLVMDTQAPAFSTDITPTLYYLLGHKPLKKNPLFGRPLFANSLEELRAYESDHYMVASSYSPIYGILDSRGESLYLADALNRENHLFDLVHDPSGRENLITFDAEKKNESLIRNDVDAIARFFHFTGKSRDPNAPESKVDRRTNQ